MLNVFPTMTLKPTALRYGFVLALGMAAVACTDSYGGNAADPRGVAGPSKPKAKGNAGATTDTTNDEEKNANDDDDDVDPTKPTDPTTPQRALEVAAYYAGYTAQTLPTSKLDLHVVDEVTHFAVIPQADGSLNDSMNMVSSESSVELVNAAKAANVRATLCVGGAGSGALFALATVDHRADLVNHIATLVNDRHYDGVDVDWEPLAPEHAPAFVALLQDLRAKLGANMTITAAVPVGADVLVAPAAPSVDRFHLMTYDLAGPYPGWVTWHNGALYNGGATFPSTGSKLPSVEGAVHDFLAAGIPASKLMLGIDHMGYAWKGGAGENGSALVAPRMTWTAPPSLHPIPFREIADSLLTPERAKWDDVAKAPFLSIDEAGTADDQFVTYEDEESQREKVSFARQQGLAGVFVWDIAAGYRPSQANPLALMKSLHEDAQATK